jgi:hypothetical protein
LADRLEEAHHVVRENNKVGRERQKEQYDKGTRLVIFQPGEMVYLRQMSRAKRGCPKFRLRWRDPYEVIRRLSDLNYLVQVSPRKELVVKSSPSPSGTRDIPVRDQEEDESQDVASDDGITPPASYDHFENEGSSVFTPSTLTDERTEDRSQDPTWEPSRRQGIQRPADESPSTRRKTVARYWLRSRQGENTVEYGETPTGLHAEGTTDTEAVKAEPPESALPEAGNVLQQEEGTEQPPRYNFRPLSGRKF